MGIGNASNCCISPKSRLGKLDMIVVLSVGRRFAIIRADIWQLEPANEKILRPISRERLRVVIKRSLLLGRLLPRQQFLLVNDWHGEMCLEVLLADW